MWVCIFATHTHSGCARGAHLIRCPVLTSTRVTSYTCVALACVCVGYDHAVIARTFHAHIRQVPVFYACDCCTRTSILTHSTCRVACARGTVLCVRCARAGTVVTTHLGMCIYTSNIRVACGCGHSLACTPRYMRAHTQAACGVRVRARSCMGISVFVCI